ALLRARPAAPRRAAGGADQRLFRLSPGRRRQAGPEALAAKRPGSATDRSAADRGAPPLDRRAGGAGAPRRDSRGPRAAGRARASGRRGLQRPTRLSDDDLRRGRPQKLFAPLQRRRERRALWISPRLSSRSALL